MRLFVWLCQVLEASCRIFSYSMRDLVAWPGIESGPLALGSWSLNPCTEGGNRTGSILKAGLHLGPDCGLWTIYPVSMEMTYQLENQAPRRKRPRALCCLKEYPNYLCNQIESYILLCLLGYDHRPIDNCPLLHYLSLRHLNHGLTVYLSFSFVQTSFREFGEVVFCMYT